MYPHVSVNLMLEYILIWDKQYYQDFLFKQKVCVVGIIEFAFRRWTHLF